VDVPANGGGASCDDIMKQTQGCHQDAPQDCIFSDWSSWSKCDQNCGGGQTYRKRDLATPASHGGECAMRSSLSETASCNTASCDQPMDCNAAEWADWTTCSASCGVGSKQRQRFMAFDPPQANARRLDDSLFDMFSDQVAKLAGTNEADAPIAQAAKMGCFSGYAGALKEVVPCYAHQCDVQDCVWENWAEWGACTLSCGGGSKRRNRVVATPPGVGGMKCEASVKSEIATCNEQTCELCIDGEWETWTEWGSCSATCGMGFQSRHRNIKQHNNQCGSPVTGVEDDYVACQGALPMCIPDIDCALTQWSTWNSCSSDCFGVSERHRAVGTMASGNGKSCVDEAVKEMQMCNPMPGGMPPAGCEKEAPRPCQVSQWGAWGSCSESCGGGQQIRLRHILSPATENGQPCNETLAETGSCGIGACPHAACVDCAWHNWDDWGACSRCGGQRYRHRSIATMPNFCGQTCTEEDAKQTGTCTSECEQTRWCAWSAWTGYGDCSAKCGPAQKSRQRNLVMLKEEPAEFLFSGSPGMTCSGTQVDSAACPFVSCDETCSPVDCAFGEWGDWGTWVILPELCERQRVIGTMNKCGGLTCNGTLEETKDCNVNVVVPQDCAFSGWEPWTQCASPEGQQYRKRKIVAEAMNGGQPCQGMLSETAFCSTPGAPEPCELSEWGEWTPCTKSAYGGLKQRTRAIRTLGANGGGSCDGALEELAICNSGSGGESSACVVAEWGTWSICDKDGQKYRDRAVQEPTNGGASCDAALREMQPCINVVDCQVSVWSGWGECSASCGGGQQQRHRQVTTNPRNGGAACPQDLMMTRGCSRDPCNRQDCLISDWTGWGACTTTCGSGQTKRSRKVIQKPQDGGLGCGHDLAQDGAAMLRPCCMRCAGLRMERMVGVVWLQSRLQWRSEGADPSNCQRARERWKTLRTFGQGGDLFVQHSIVPERIMRRWFLGELGRVAGML